MKTIGVFAHVDAGKTTFSEQVLYHCEALAERGRVDHQTSFLDHHTIEKQRGITVFADQTLFTYEEEIYQLIDTPGHIDFSPEMERSLQVLDAAVLVISATDGIQGHTETVWKLLKKRKIPTLLFVNKMDQEGANRAVISQEIMEQLTPFVLEDLVQDGAITLSASCREQLAEVKDEWLEAYVEDTWTPEEWTLASQEAIAQSMVCPLVYGSALKGQGIAEALLILHTYCQPVYEAHTALAARVYKIRHDEAGHPLVFVKIEAGTLSVRQSLQFQLEEEKVTQIRIYRGREYDVLPEARAGQLVALVGIKTARVGDVLGNLLKSEFELVPTLQAEVLDDGRLSKKEVVQKIRQLEVEDPSLKVIWQEETQSLMIHVMGMIQLEILEEILPDRFGFSVQFGEPQIVYRETIQEPVTGYGHFEPLRHYAEVHLRLEPLPRGSGFQFASVCHPNDLQEGHQRVIRDHLFERDHNGVLTGSAVTDIKCTLLRGRIHKEYTSGGDLREAAFRALRQGLEQVESVLLEPIYEFTMRMHSDYIGKVLMQIQQAAGSFETPQTKGSQVEIIGQVPVATFLRYPQTFAALTGGKGSLTLRFAGYAPCHNAKEVIKEKAYKKDADPFYSSNSVFCTKGKGYSIPWHEAKAAMHCPTDA